MKKDMANLKMISMQTPGIIPVRSENCVAFYLRNTEELYHALHAICVNHRMDVGHWSSYDKYDRDDFDKFRHECKWNSGFLEGCVDDRMLFSKETEWLEGPDWYIFQHYTQKGLYWSENSGQYEDCVHNHIHVSKLSEIKERVDTFFAKFDGQEVE